MSVSLEDVATNIFVVSHYPGVILSILVIVKLLYLPLGEVNILQRLRKLSGSACKIRVPHYGQVLTIGCWYYFIVAIFLSKSEATFFIIWIEKRKIYLLIFLSVS